jgi:predicted metal-binding membrane protein
MLAVLLGALALASWATLWLWSASPYSGYLAHTGWADPAAFAALCRVVPGGEIAVRAILHAFAWMLMLAAMMLPTTYPLLAMFQRIAGARPDGRRLLALVIAGFLAVWFAFGILAHGADALLADFAQRSPWLSLNGWAVAALVLAGAGAFQFSALKYRCLEECHAPFGFVSSRWHGQAPMRDAFRIGVDHGVFCVGCCWALMLVMFAVGGANLGWMLALAALMFVEKAVAWGRAVTVGAGLTLAGWGLGLLLGIHGVPRPF